MKRTLMAFLLLGGLALAQADGAKIYAQYVVLGGLFGAPDLITVASNGLVHTIGRR